MPDEAPVTKAVLLNSMATTVAPSGFRYQECVYRGTSTIWHRGRGLCSPGTMPSVVEQRVRRGELGAFLRSRRARITPDQVGLPFNGRRRTPGLRREEVAQLAGIGVAWYTWLEQGRAIN